MYDIFLCEKSNYIDSMEEQLKKAEGWNKGMLCYMLAIQYQNKGDKAKKAEYLKLAEEDLKETPYAGKIEKMIKEN